MLSPRSFRVVQKRVPSVIAHADHLVTIHNLLCASRLYEPHPVSVMRNLVRLDRIVQPFAPQPVLNPAVQKSRAARAIAIDASSPDQAFGVLRSIGGFRFRNRRVE
jgi:hypothetical protein